MFLLKQLPVWKVVVMTLGFLTGLLRESGRMLESPSPTPTLLQATGMQLQPEFADLMLLPPASASPGPPPTSRPLIQQDHLSAGNDHPLQGFGRNVSLGGMFFEEDTPLETDLVTRVPAEPALGYPPDAIPSLTTNLSTDHSMTATASQRPPLIWVSPSTHILRHRVEHSRVSLGFQTSPDNRANETSPAELLCSTDSHPSTGVHPLDFSSRVTNLAPTGPIPSSEGASASDYHLASWHLAMSPDGRGITSSAQPEAMSAEPIMGSSLPTTDLPFGSCRWPNLVKALFEKTGWIFEQWAVGGNALISLSIFSSFLGVIMLLIQLLCKDHRHYRKTALRPLRIQASHQRLHLGEVQLEFLRGASAKRLILPIRTTFFLLVLPVIFLPSVGLPMLVWLLIQLWHAFCRRNFIVRSNIINSLDAETRTAQPSCQSPNMNNSNNRWGKQKRHLFTSFRDFFLGNSVDMETDNKNVEETMEIDADGDENMEVDEEVVSMETDEVDGCMKAEEDMDVDLRPAEIMNWEQIVKIRGGWDSTGFHIEQDHVFIRQPLHTTSPCDQLKVFDMEWQGKAGQHAVSSSATSVIPTTPTAVATPASTMVPLPSGIPQPPPLPSTARGPVEISRGEDAPKVRTADLLNSKQAQSRTTIRKHPRRHSRSLRVKRDPMRGVAGRRLKNRPCYNQWSQALWQLSSPICFQTASAHQQQSPTGPELVEDILRQWREKEMEHDIKDEDIPALEHMQTPNSEEKQTNMIDLGKFINELEKKFSGGIFTDQETKQERAPADSDPGNTNHEGSSDRQNNQGSNTDPEAQETVSDEAKYDVKVPLKKLEAMTKSETVEEEASTADVDSVTRLRIGQIIDMEQKTVMGGGCDDSHLDIINISGKVPIHQHHCTGMADEDDLVEKLNQVHITDKFDLKTTRNLRANESDLNTVEITIEPSIQPHNSGSIIDKSDCGEVYSMERIQRSAIKEEKHGKTDEEELVRKTDEEELVRKLKSWHITEENENDQNKATEPESNATGSSGESPSQHHNSDNIGPGLAVNKSTSDEAQVKAEQTTPINTLDGHRTPVKTAEDTGTSDEEDLVRKLNSLKITEENGCDLQTEPGKVNEPDSNTTQEPPILTTLIKNVNGQRTSVKTKEDTGTSDEEDLVRKLNSLKITEEIGCDLQTEQGKVIKPDSNTTQESTIQTTPIKTVDGQRTSVKTVEDTGTSDEEHLVRKLESLKITEENGCDLQTEQGKVNEPDSNTTQVSPIQTTPIKTVDGQRTSVKTVEDTGTSDEEHLVRKLNSLKITEENGCDLQTEQGKVNEPDSNTTQVSPIQTTPIKTVVGQITSVKTMEDTGTSDEEHLVRKLNSLKITEEIGCDLQTEQGKVNKPDSNTTQESTIQTTPIKTVVGQITSVKTMEDTGTSDEEHLVRKLNSLKITEENGCDLQTELGKGNKPDSNSTQEPPIQHHCSCDITPSYICNESTCDETYEGNITSSIREYLDDLVRKLKSVKISRENNNVLQSEQNKAEDSGLNTIKLLEDASYYHGHITTSEMIQEGSLKVQKHTACVETESNTFISDEETPHSHAERIASQIAQDKANKEDSMKQPCNMSVFSTTNIIRKKIRYQHAYRNTLPVIEEETSVEADNEKITGEKSDSNTPTTSEKPPQCHGETRMTQKGACVEVDNKKLTAGKSNLNATTFSERTSDKQSENIKLSVIQDKVSVEADDEKKTNEKSDLNTVINDTPSYCLGDIINPQMIEEGATVESDIVKNKCEELNITHTTPYCHSDMTTSNTIQERAQFEGNINQENKKVQALGTASEQNFHGTNDKDSAVLISAAPIALETRTSKDEMVKPMESLDISNSEAPHLDASNNHPLPSLSTLMLNTHGKGSRASRQELNFRYLRPTKRLPSEMAHQRNAESNDSEQSGSLSSRKSMRSIKARVKQRAQAIEQAKEARSRIRNIQLENEGELDQRSLCEVVMRTSLLGPEASTTNSTKEPATPDAESLQQETALISRPDNLMVSEVSNVIFNTLENKIQTSEQNLSRPSSDALKSEPDVTAKRPTKKVTFKVTPLCSDEDSKPSSLSRKYGLTSVSRSLLNSKARMEKSRQERREQATERTKQAKFQLRSIEVQDDEDSKVTLDNTGDISLTTSPLRETGKPSSPNKDIPEKSKSIIYKQQISSLAELNFNNKSAEYQSDHGCTTENKIPNSTDDTDILSQLQHLEVSKPSKLKQENLQREMMLQLNSNGKGSAVTKPEMKFRFARPKKRVLFSVPDDPTDSESGEQSNPASLTKHKSEARRKRREQFFTRAKEARFQNRHIEPHDDDDDSGIDDNDDDDDDNKPLPACPTSSTTADKSKNEKAGSSSSQLNSNDKDSTDPTSPSSEPSISINVPHTNSCGARKLDGPLRSNKQSPMAPPRDVNFRYVRPNGRVTFRVAPLVEEGGGAVNCGRSSQVRPSSPHLSIDRRNLEKARQKRRDEAQDRARLARFRLRGIELEDDDDGEMLQKDMENTSLTMRMIEEQAKKQETQAIIMATEDQTEASASSRDLMQQLNSNRKGSNEGAVGEVRDDTDDEEWGLANQLQHLEVSKNIPPKEQTEKNQRLQRELMLQLNSNNKGTDEELEHVFHFQASANSGELMQQLNSNNKGSVTTKRTEMKFRFERPRKSVKFILPDEANGGSDSQDMSHPGSTSSTSLCLHLNEERKTRKNLFLERAKHARFLKRQIELSDDDDDENDDANNREKLPTPSFAADPIEIFANPSNPKEHGGSS